MKKIVLGLFFFGITSVSYSQITTSSLSIRADIATNNSQTGTPDVTDFNNDGKPDIIIPGNATTNRVSIFINNATPGTYSISNFTKVDVSTAASTSPYHAVCADLDGDGKKDLIVGFGHSSANYISVYRNTTSGSTVSFASAINYTAGNQPRYVFVEDLDGDGKLDIVAANYNNNNASTVSVFRNISSSGTISFSSSSNFNVGAAPSFIRAADFNADGKKELVVTNFNGFTNSNSISILNNTSTSGSISFTSALNLTTSTWGAIHTDIGDIDGDGKLDIATGVYNGAVIAVYRNTTSGSTISFTSAVTFSYSGGDGSHPNAFALKDIDNDGKLDMIAGITAGGTFASAMLLFKNTATSGVINSSTFASEVSFTLPAHTVGNGTGVSGVFPADFDLDGKPDIFAGLANTDKFSIWRNQALVNEPTAQVSNLSISGTDTSVTLSFTKGNGTRRMVVVKAVSAVSVNPSDSTAYDADSVFGSGSQLGSGNYVVYNDTGSKVTVTGLTKGETYHVAVYEANGSGAYENILTTSPLIGSRSLITAIYYSKSSGNLNELSTWGTNTDGSGTAPANFTTAGVMYKVQNNSSPSLGGNLTIGGSGSFLSLGDGTNSFNLVVPSGNTLAVDSIGVSTNITLTVQGTLASNKIYFQNSSTAQFTSSSTQNIPKGNYANLIAVSSEKTLIGDVKVRGTLVMNTNIVGGSYTLTLGESTTATGTLNRSSGIIQGRFARWFAASANTGNTGLFPIGSGSSYLPTLINYTSAPSAGGLITLEFITGNSGNNGLPLYDFSADFVTIDKAAQNGFWRMTTTGVSGGTYTATLTAANFWGVNEYASLRMLQRANSSASWTIPGTAQLTTGSNSNAVLVREGLSTGSCELGVGGDQSVNPLPVKWQSFTATFNKASNNVELNWATASEINNDYFEVQRSTDNSIWQFVERVNSRGNTNTLSIYKAFDNTLPTSAAQLYYRIKQVDRDGTFSYSSNAAVVLPNTRTTISIFPLPLQSQLTIQLEKGEEFLGVKIFDTTSKLVAQSKETTLSVAELQSGMYLIEVQTNLGSSFTKVTK